MSEPETIPQAEPAPTIDRLPSARDIAADFLVALRPYLADPNSLEATRAALKAADDLVDEYRIRQRILGRRTAQILSGTAVRTGYAGARLDAQGDVIFTWNGSIPSGH